MEETKHKFFNCNRNYAESDNFFPMTASDESYIAGHLIMRFTDAESGPLVSFDILKAEKVTLGVLQKPKVTTTATQLLESKMKTSSV